jgi:hypothetical protein
VSATALARIEAAIGWESVERTHTIEAGRLRRFAEAIGDSNHRWPDEVPPTFLVTMLAEPPDFPGALDYGAGWLNAGDRFEYVRPIRAGAGLRSQTRLTNAYEKKGSTGRMLFLVFETVFRNADGQLVAKHIGARIRR